MAEFRRMKVEKNPDYDDNPWTADCLDCEWSGERDEADIDYEWDEFKGNDVPYLICPKCGGGVDVN